MKMTYASQQEEIARLQVLANVTEQVNDLQGDLDEHGDRIDNLDEDTNDLESLVTTRLDAQMSRIDTVQKYSQQVNKEVQELRELVRNQAAEISEMKRLGQQKDQQIQNLMELMSAQTLSVQALSTETKNKLQDVVFTQTNQERRFNSLAQNSTEENLSIKQRIEELSFSLDNVKAAVTNTTQSMEESLQEAIAEQIDREQEMNSDITMVRTNISENAQVIQNIYLELVTSLSLLRSRINRQERTMAKFINETREPAEEGNNVIETMPPTGPTLEDLEALRVRLSTHEGMVSSLNSSVRSQFNSIQERFNSRILNLNTTLRTELANVVLSIPQRDGQSVSNLSIRSETKRIQILFVQIDVFYLVYLIM